MLGRLSVSSVVWVGRLIENALDVYVDEELHEEDKYGQSVLNSKGWKKVSQILSQMAGVAEVFGSKSIAQTLRSYVESDDPLSQASFYVVLDFWSKSISDAEVFLIKPGMSEHYGKENYFGERVSDVFPAASKDIKSCGSCFALSEYTAAVYHALRALEIPIQAMSSDLGIDKFKNWNSALNELEQAVRSRDNHSNLSDWDTKKEFYTDAINHLFAVKNAWRNHTMHLQLTFDRDDSEEIIRAVRSFMRKASNVVGKGSTTTSADD